MSVNGVLGAVGAVISLLRHCRQRLRLARGPERTDRDLQAVVEAVKDISRHVGDERAEYDVA